MTSSVTSREAVPSARHLGHDARLLADSLRTSRMTLLYGEVGVSRTALLTDGVLPLLRRRAGDGPTRSGRQARAAAPRTERRNAGAGRRRHSERVVLFDDWAGSPLAALEVAILSSLPMGVVMQAEQRRLSDLLAELCNRLDARFLIVFDAFERLWGPDARAVATFEFVEQLSEAANRTDLHANFLISIDESAAPRLEGLRQRILGFDDSTLWLHTPSPPQINPDIAADPAADPKPSPVLDSLPVLPLVDSVPAVVRSERIRRKRPPRQPLPPSTPIKTETVYAFIESTLTQTASASEPWQGTGDASVVAARAPSEMRVALPRQSPDRSARERPRGVAAQRRLASASPQPDEGGGPLVEPPSPIDQWLDAAISWCRRLLRRQ